MKRRGLFSFFAAAPLGIVTGVSAATQKKPDLENKPLIEETNIVFQGGFSFSHGTPLKNWVPNSQLICAQVPPQTNIKNHGSIIMHEGELFIRPDRGEWRKIS